MIKKNNRLRLKYLFLFCCLSILFFSTHLNAQNRDLKLKEFAIKRIPLIKQSSWDSIFSSRKTLSFSIKNKLKETVTIKRIKNRGLKIELGNAFIDEIALLDYKDETIICHIHTLLSPFSISQISFWKNQSTPIPNQDLFPNLDFRNFLILKKRKASKNLELKKDLDEFPISYHFSKDLKKISARIDYRALLTEEYKKKLLELYSLQTINLYWKNNKFQIK